jgi:hypothetical protein
LAATVPGAGETIVAASSPGQDGGIASGEHPSAPFTVEADSASVVLAAPVIEQVAQPADDKAAIEGKGTVIAALPRPSVAPNGSASGPAKPNRLQISDFLTEREDSGCLLAIPQGISPTQASIAAFALERGAVERLAVEYQKLSGMTLKAETRPVSHDQCSALAFARGLAQYPNFPLRVSLAKPVIHSGQELAGVVSGLRKDTIYLVVVDDEGKAELITSYSGQRASIVDFNAPMTLTSGPVSSVQLLIAIASDGPLRTVPHRPGMPAEEYFSRLATEIISGNRSIAYGITSFVVK